MKFIKRLVSISFLIMIIFCFSSYNTVSAISLDSMEQNGSDFIKKGADSAGDLNPVLDAVTDNFNGLGQILTMVGAGVLVAVISYMGIKYLVSPPDKQAALKQQLIGVVVAGIVIFGAYGIWSAILSIVSAF